MAWLRKVRPSSSRRRCRAGLSTPVAWVGAIAASLITAPLLLAAETGETDPGVAGAMEFFEQNIRPILVRRCYECHGPESDEPEGNLRLDHRAGWAQGGDRGPAIVPGKPRQSLLIEAIDYEDPEFQMPPENKLPQREIDLLRRWVAIGAPDPRVLDQSPTKKRRFDLARRKAKHWSWRPIERPGLPSVEDTAWPLDGLDRFILARLDSAHLRPASDVERATWLRRLSFDLRGLPPTPDEVKAFLADQSPDAYKRIVDRFLADPAYAEHWAQYWLDLVRFAETKGHEQDFGIPEAWRYRDYVIRAIAANVPYDRFVMEHIAGDLMQPPRVDPLTHTNQSIQGTGFWHLGEATHSPVDIRGDEADRMANKIGVFGKAFLALTMGCTRCHDHKFDALTTADYYALCGFLQSSSYRLADVADPMAQHAAFHELTRLHGEYGPRLAAGYAELTEQRLRDLPDLLVKAVEQIPAVRSTSLEGNSPHVGDTAAETTAGAATDAKQRPLAEESESPAQRLAREIMSARDSPDHPLFPLAVAAMDYADHALAEGPTPAESFDVRPAIQSVLDQWSRREAETAANAIPSVDVMRKDGELNVAVSKRPFDPAKDLVADFSRFSAKNWITSGLRFGTAPATPGTLILSASAEHPIKRVVEQGAACGEVVSPKFSGFLRTPTFEIVGDTLWYRYRGQAKVFLAVDSHRTVFGPLHAVVKQRLNSPDRVAQFGHNVRDYLGHRVHVEFTPTGPFELYDIRFGESAPPLAFKANELLRDTLRSRAVHTLRELAESQTAAFRVVLNRMTSGLDQDERTGDVAVLMNWLLEHDAILPKPSGPPPDAERRFRDLARQYAAERKAAEARIPAPVFALALLDGSGENERIHIRGNHKHLADKPTPRRFLEALDGPAGMKIPRGSGRLQLARRLVDPANPLTARVMVNRVWSHLLGRGIVPTVDDFGAMGQPPTHPQLLDYLAVEFVEDGWNVNDLVRRIVLSRTYRMSSRSSPEADAVDPINAFYHRAAIHRLAAEAIRDSILAVSGELDRTTYGHSVPVHITEFMRNNRSPKGSGPRDSNGRRSIYIEVRRNHISHFLAAFDRPAPSTTIGRRNVSNSPAQPLILLNDPFVFNQAKKWAQHLLSDSGNDAQRALDSAFLAAFAREPTVDERQKINRFLAATIDRDTDDRQRLAAWTEVCHTLLNVKEFIFLN